MSLLFPCFLRITFPFLREEIEDVAQSVNDLMGRQVNHFVGTERRTLWKTMRTYNNFLVSITIIDFQIFVWSDWRTNKREVEFEKVTRGLLKLLKWSQKPYCELKTSTTEVWISRTLWIHSSNILLKLIQHSFCDFRWIISLRRLNIFLSCFEMRNSTSQSFYFQLILHFLSSSGPLEEFIVNQRVDALFQVNVLFKMFLSSKNILLKLLVIGDW